MSESATFELASVFIERLCDLDPLLATALGVPGRDAEMTDFSPEGEAARADLCRDTLRSLDSVPAVDAPDRIAQSVLRERLELRLARFEAGRHLSDIAMYATPLQWIRSRFDAMPRESKEQREVIAERMAQVPAAIEGYRRALRAGLERGVPASRRQALVGARQARVFAGRGDAEPFFAALARGLSQDGEAPDLEVRAERASNAYAELAKWLQDEYAPAARERDGVGRERYALEARDHHGAELDLDDTYAWGLEELSRLRVEIDAAVREIEPGADLETVSAGLDDDPAYTITGFEGALAWHQELQDRALAELDGSEFDVPARARKIEVRAAPAGSGPAIHYSGPSEDFERPGRIWYPNTGRERIATWREVATAHHEGVPGHHLQVATALDSAAQLSRFQRLLGATSAYEEGWALYAERLMAELGYFDDPAPRLGLLLSQAFRAARVVVDLGLHLELETPEGVGQAGARWSRELAHGFLLPFHPSTPEDAWDEVDRYLGMPAQAISYKVGERYWLRAREVAREREGRDFNLRRWHNAALRAGPMGLEQLVREPLAYSR